MAWHAAGGLGAPAGGCLGAVLDLLRGSCTEKLRMVSGGLGTAERACFSRLVAAHRRLSLSTGRDGMPSNDSAAVLDALATAAAALGAEMAPRVYRRSFTQNYRLLIPDRERHYRAEILEAGMEPCTAIWVNGELFEFSAEAVGLAVALQRAWTALGALLDRCFRSSVWPSPPKIRSAMAAFDAAWAGFEHRYISELIAIEQKARHLVVRAAEHEKKLQQLEGTHEGEKSEALHSSPEYRKEQECLAWCVSRLNAVANADGKGRNDLGVGVLFAALETRRQCVAAEKVGQSTDATAAAKALATGVIESFDAVRGYLRSVADSLDRLDPQLQQNAVLVERLVDWERKWEMGSRYIQNPRLLNNLCDIVAFVRQAQCSVPAFAAMLQNLDPEVFMALPRLILLRFLVAPGQHSELMKSLVLPAFIGNDEFKAFEETFQSARQALAAAVPRPRGMSAEAALWDLLVKRAVLGTIGTLEPRDAVPQHTEPARGAVGELARALEPWSIRLQRHCPEDWNQCVAAIVGCLSRESPAVIR